MQQRSPIPTLNWTGALVVTSALLVAGCSSEVELAAAESFRWCEKGPAVSFAPPATSWQRSKLQSRAAGVAFVYRDVPPGYITAGMITNICRQDTRTDLLELYNRFEEYSPAQFRKAVHMVRRFENTGFTYEADEMIKQVNAALTRAETAYLAADMSGARSHIESALDAAEAFEYELEDLAYEYMLDPEELPNPDRYRIEDPFDHEVDGLPALVLEYTMEEERGEHHGRHVYVAFDNNLFVFTYLGPEKHLPVFDALMRTVTFPEDEES